MWKRFLWPEFEVFWFNSVLNRSSEWGTHSIQWYFTSALPRSLLAAYPLFMLGVLLDRRLLPLVLPALSFVVLYSKLPHKELRFIISSVPIFNLSAAVAASRISEDITQLILNFFVEHIRLTVELIAVFPSLNLFENLCKTAGYLSQKKLIWTMEAEGGVVVYLRGDLCVTCFCYNNRKKSFWKFLNLIMLGLLLISLGCTIITFMASYENYPSGHALKELHQIGHLANKSNELWVHIDPFSAMNGISRFCENEWPWRYSKEEEIALEEFGQRNFTYLINEHRTIDGYKCLFYVNGFSRLRRQSGFPPIILDKEPKVYIHGNIKNEELMLKPWPGCS
ncbi:hypothetical protein GOBAR_AA37104 [Gossypium barbadense]|uniref:Mannosyltransferase n=1 Tax=Gossypium barbadense TaxID=3634 RepID=A0A2P5VXR9_GOSBA|nr:hypothetical protein GOBAR_AA37104 [Gossypium barbadense]